MTGKEELLCFGATVLLQPPNNWLLFPQEGNATLCVGQYAYSLGRKERMNSSSKKMGMMIGMLFL